MSGGFQPTTAGSDSTVESIISDHGAMIEPPLRLQPPGAPWDYEIRIALPWDYYVSGDSYPVLWCTDGRTTFEQAVSTVSSAYGLAIPQMIVVSVGTPTDQSRLEHIRRRTYDFTSSTVGDQEYEGVGGNLFEEIWQASFFSDLAVETGGAEHFADFLIYEARPIISSRYRTCDDHTLYGYSAGGTFCAYALFSRTDQFRRYICGSPGLYGQKAHLFALEEAYAAAHSDLKAQLVFNVGEGEILEGGLVSAIGVVSGTMRMAEILALRKYPSLRLSVQIIPGKVHNDTAVSESLYRGLIAVFGRE